MSTQCLRLHPSPNWCNLFLVSSVVLNELDCCRSPVVASPAGIWKRVKQKEFSQFSFEPFVASTSSPVGVSAFSPDHMEVDVKNPRFCGVQIGSQMRRQIRKLLPRTRGRGAGGGGTKVTGTRTIEARPSRSRGLGIKALGKQFSCSAWAQFFLAAFDNRFLT